MFPISDELLSLLRIARYWAREIGPLASASELRLHMEQAWWRGEMLGESSPDRLSALQSMYRTCQDCVAFAPAGMPGPPQTEELANGGLNIIRPVWVPVPSTQSDAWTEASCAESFDAVADGWWIMPEKVEHILGPIVAGVEIQRDVFRRWIIGRYYTRPKFWGNLRTSRLNRPERPMRRFSGSEITQHVKQIVELQREQGKYPSEQRVKDEAIARGLKVPRDVLRGELTKLNGPRRRGRPPIKSRP